MPGKGKILYNSEYTYQTIVPNKEAHVLRNLAKGAKDSGRDMLLIRDYIVCEKQPITDPWMVLAASAPSMGETASRPRLQP